MKQQILDDIIKAMKEKDKVTLTVLRSVKGAIQLEEINKKGELSDSDIIGVLSKQIKLRKESIVDFEKGNREDLKENALKEIEILNKYMPEQLTKEEVDAIITEIINEVKPTSPSDMGKIMGKVTPKVKGKFDMSEVSKIVKDKISNL